MTTSKSTTIRESLERGKSAAADLAASDVSIRDSALIEMASLIEKSSTSILEANRKDLEKAESLLASGELSEALVSRLKLSESKIKDIASGIRQVANLDNPVGKISMATELDSGLDLYRVSTPLGVIAVIFESRPDALPQIASLAIKSANVAILKGGKEAENTLTAIFECLQQALVTAGLSRDSLLLLNTREDVKAILEADDLVDLVIPRGSSELVRHIQSNTRIPVLGHAEGICHLYVHDDADPEMAIKLSVDAKTQYPSACNATETILIHEDIVDVVLSSLVRKMKDKQVELRLEESLFESLNEEERSEIRKAADSDWSEEYCDLILSVKAVDSLESAISHINRYGSGHTDCIVTRSRATYDKFFKMVDSAGVFWNASTRFADGFRYGFGAEVGIATGKLHPRGPVGLEGLVTYKYRLEGNGQVVEDYAGPDARAFTHRPLGPESPRE